MNIRVCLALVAAAGCHSAHANIITRFNTDVEGWRVVAFPFGGHVANPATTNASFDATFGMPAGSIRVGDVYSDTGISAPAAFLGNHSDAYGGQLTYDIFVRYTDGVDYPAVVINAGAFSLYYVTVSPPLETWESRVVPLTETGWRYNSRTGPFATEAQMRAALANIVGLYIFTEWRTGPDDTSVDNISIPGGCTADLNNDGFVNGDDYDYFASMFEAADPGADINSDSFVNGDDYDLFASAFESGC
ncbi:MAG: hypothetical protein IT434_16035 [Phycisphaerales bacterium]|jgi:hypothetical protein|nr:hypothetical protein [Phycisphaerales bacterium]